MKWRLSFIGQFLFWPDAKSWNIFASRSWCLFKDFILLSEKDRWLMIITECISLFSNILAELELEIKQLRLKKVYENIILSILVFYLVQLLFVCAILSLTVFIVHTLFTPWKLSLKLGSWYFSIHSDLSQLIIWYLCVFWHIVGQNQPAKWSISMNIEPRKC